MIWHCCCSSSSVRLQSCLLVDSSCNRRCSVWSFRSPTSFMKAIWQQKKMFGRTCLNIVFMHLSSTFSYKSFIRWSIRRNKSLILVFIQANVLTVSSYQHHEITLCQHMKQDISLVIAWVDALYLWLQKERQTRWITKHSAPAFTWTIILFW